MAWNYVVTAHKPTAATLGLTGYFTHQETGLPLLPPDLVVVKGRNLYFYQFENGLKLLIEIPIFGNLDCLQSYRLKESKKDVLCFMTSWNLVRVVEVNDDQFVTRAHGVIEVPGGQHTEYGSLMRVDQEYGLLGIIAFLGYLHIVFLSAQDTSDMASFSTCIRLSELVVVDFVFLRGYASSTIALLTQTVEGRQLRTYEVTFPNEKSKSLTTCLTSGPIPNDTTKDTEAHMLIPVGDAMQGVLVVGRSVVSYYSATCCRDSNHIPKQREAFSCYTQIAPDRMILGDDRGQLFMVLLRYNSEEREMTGINVEFIGETCIPSFLGYLNDVLFVGSKLGDSQLIHFTEATSSMVSSVEAPAPESRSIKDKQYFEVLDSIANIGPIVDMQVVDLEKHGQGQLVTCSGYRKGGSLRIIRNGIGIESKATVDLPGIVSVWTLSLNKSIVDGSCVQLVHDTIVFTTSNTTHFLKMVGLDMEEYELTELGDAVTDAQSLHISNVVHSQIVQVTSSSLRLLRAPGFLLLSEWKPSSGHQIDKVSGNNSQLLIAAKTHLYYLVVLEGAVQCADDRELHYEIPCLDISPTQMFGEANVCAICLWTTVTINMLSLPNLMDISVTKIPGRKSPGSIQLCWDLEGVQYLLCTIENDGSLIYYQIDPSCGALFNEKHIILGKEPVRLIQFFSHGKSNIFACSDKPTIIYSHNKKLTFSDVDQPKVTCMASLNNECYPEHLVLAHYNQLEIGKIDKIQKLHIRKIPLEETPYRIAHQEPSKTLGVLSCRYGLCNISDDGCVVSDTIRSASLRAPSKTQLPLGERTVEKSLASVLEHGEEVEIHSLLILDQHSFDVIFSYEFKLQESAVSIISCVVNSIPYYVVGTAFTYPFEEEPSSGRLLAFQVSEGRLELIYETDVAGCVYSIRNFNDMIVCSINATIALYNIDTENGFNQVGTHYGSVISLMLKTKGDFVLVGDLMKSIILLNYQKDKPKPFIEIAQDFDSKWMLALEFIDDDSFLGCENFRNLFTLIKNPDVSTEAEQSRLVQFGQFYLGESVNVLTHGSLVMETAENRPEFIQGNSIIYAGVSGSVGLVIPISEEAYNILVTVQKRLIESGRILAVGNIDHSDWRTYKNLIVKKPAQNFIDGDVVETLLELPRPDMTALIQDIEIKDKKGGVRTVSVEEVFRIIEELARLH